MSAQVFSILPRWSNMSSNWQSVRRILAIRLDNIGDVVMLSPALRAIQAALPQAEITLMASPGGAQVAPLLPWFHAVIPWQAVWQDIRGADGHTPSQELQLAEDLSSRHFDAAFIFTSFSQSPFPPAYVCFLAGIPIRIGQSEEFGGGLLTHWVKPPGRSGHQVDRNLHLIQSSGLPLDGSQIELHIPFAVQQKADTLLQTYGVDPAAPFLILAPGASAAARRYEPARFAEVVKLLFNDTGLPVVVLGNEKERQTIQPVISACESGTGIDLVGLTSIPEMAALIRRASLVIANNSAALHIADAFRRPLVVTYSGTEYLTQWEPRNSPATLLRRETNCSPCFKFQCPYHMECLDLPPEEVARAAISLLGNVYGARPFGLVADELQSQIRTIDIIDGGER